MIHCGCAGFSRDAAECLAQRFQFTTAERIEQREREYICECRCHDVETAAEQQSIIADDKITDDDAADAET